MFALRWPERRGSWRAFGADVHGLWRGARRRWRPLEAGDLVREVARLHREGPFDVVHALWADTTTLFAALAARRIGAPLVCSIAGGELADLPGYGGSRSRFGAGLVRAALESADVVTAGSRWVADRSPVPARVVPLGVAIERFPPRPPPDRATRWLTVASLSRVKDHETALRAFAQLRVGDPALSLTIAGDGPERERLEGLATGLQLPVRWLGHVPWERMPEIYRDHDALVHPSSWEAQGMVVLEALACGLPVVASDVGIAAELPTVVRFPPADVGGLVRAIGRVRASPRDHVVPGAALDHAVERQALRFLDVYRSVRSGPSGVVTRP